MTILIPGTHYYLPSVPNPDETFTLTCALCADKFTSGSSLTAYDNLVEHWDTAHDHGDLIQ